jgi:hypothetical protein
MNINRMGRATNERGHAKRFNKPGTEWEPMHKRFNSMRDKHNYFITVDFDLIKLRCLCIAQ